MLACHVLVCLLVVLLLLICSFYSSCWILGCACFGCFCSEQPLLFCHFCMDTCLLARLWCVCWFCCGCCCCLFVHQTRSTIADMHPLVKADLLCDLVVKLTTPQHTSLQTTASDSQPMLVFLVQTDIAAHLQLLSSLSNGESCFCSQLRLQCNESLDNSCQIAHDAALIARDAEQNDHLNLGWLR